MTSPLWSLVEFASRPLDRDEREAVLGDSLEAGDSIGQALFGVVGFVFRRQLLLWKNWRPWLATFGLGVPTSFLLMYVSVSVTCTSERLLGFDPGPWAPTGHEGFLLLLCHIFLLIAWSWTSGFAVGSLSPRTLWCNATLFLAVALYFAFHICFPSVSKFSPFLFLLPAICGVRQGMQGLRITFGPASILAVAVTVLMISAWNSGALWVFNWLLICPSWYLVATAHKPDGGWDRSGTRGLQRPIRT